MGTKSPNNLILAALRATKYEIRDRVYKNESVSLDGYTFINCAFFGCILITSNGNFRFKECFIGLGCTIYFSGSAQRVVKLTSMLDWKNSSPDLIARTNTDGSVTIE